MNNVAVKYAGVPERVGAQITRAQAWIEVPREEAYQPRQEYARDLSFEEAERRINALKAEIALADSFC